MFEMLLGPAGGLVGVLGALFKHGIEVYQEKKKNEASLLILVEQNKHEAVMADKEAELIKLEAANALVLTELNKAKEFDNAGWNAMGASYEADRATYSEVKDSPWLVAVDVVRGLIRPALTVIFSAATIAFAAFIWNAVPDTVVSNPDFLKETFYRLIDALIFLATSSAGWWFAARQITKGK